MVDKINSFLDSNTTTIVLLLNQEERKSIGDEIIMYLEDNLTSKDLVIIINYLKTTPTQGDKIINFILKIGIEKTIFLIENIDRAMFTQLLAYVKAEKLSEVFKEYTDKEIVTFIGEYHYYNVSIERKEHILIKSLNRGTLPNIIEKIKLNILIIREKINNIFNK